LGSVFVKRVIRTAAVIALAATTMFAAACSPSAQQRKANGDRYLTQKQYNQAIIEYQAALKSNPKLGEARAKLGEAYAANGDTAKAVGEYIRAADLLPDNIPLQIVAVRAFLTAGRFEDARTRAQQILEKQPRNAAAQSLLGSALIGMKDPEGAIKELEHAIELDPTRGSAHTALGALKVSTGDRAAAEQAFKRAVALDPKAVQGRLTLANFLWWSERMDEAEAAFKEALAVAPKDESANRSLAIFYISTKRAAQAEEYLRTYATTAQTADAGVILAEYYLSMNQRPRAVAVLEKLAADKPAAATIEARWRLASLYYGDGKQAQAHTMIDEMLRADPNEARALLVKADFFQKEGKLDQALAAARQAVTAEPQNARAHNALGVIYRKRHELDKAIASFNEVVRLNPRATSAEVALAQLHLQQSNLPKSAQYAQDAIKAEPTDGAAHLTLINNYISQGDGKKAEAALKPLLAENPNLGPLHAYMGAAQILNNNPTAARQSFERALSLDPKSTEAFAGLVSLDMAVKHFADAMRRVDARLAVAPDDPSVLVLAAQVYGAAGARDRIEPLLRHAIEIDPVNVRPYDMLGRYYISTKQLDAARAQFEAIVARRPNDVGAHTMVALLLEAQNKTAEAQKRYEHVLEIDPHAAVAANNLAAIYADGDASHLDRALELAQAAKAATPEKAEIDDTLGWVYFRKNLIPAALPLFRSSVEKNPNEPLYHYHLGLAYAKTGDRVRARQSLETALRLAPGFAKSDDARRVLDSL
jgi:tetratricopeptide (TPR) repeat protein